ncbi:MAG: hypothetical protein Q9178_005238 [Gyalolechia marmorata]
MTTRSFSIPFDPKPIPCTVSNAPSSPLTSSDAPSQPILIFTHGAGGTLTSSAIANFSTGFSRHFPVLCFQGNSNLASRTRMFSAVINDRKSSSCLGGRSMGARAAVMAATAETKCLVLVSYPLHTGKQLRDQLLLDIDPSVKVIFISGDKDSMCDLARLEEVRSRMRCQTWRVVVEGADHGMDVKPKKFTEAIGVKTGEVAANWIEDVNDRRREGRIFYDDDGKVEWTGWMVAEADSPRSIPKATVSPKPTSDKVRPSKSTTDQTTSTKDKSTPKRPRAGTSIGDTKSELSSKRARGSTHAALKGDSKKENVSARTRASKRTRPP